MLSDNLVRFRKTFSEFRYLKFNIVVESNGRWDAGSLSNYLDQHRVDERLSQVGIYDFYAEIGNLKKGVIKNKENTNRMILYTSAVLYQNRLVFHERFQCGRNENPQIIRTEAKKQLRNMSYTDGQSGRATGKVYGNDDLAISILWFIYIIKNRETEKKASRYNLAKKMGLSHLQPFM